MLLEALLYLLPSLWTSHHYDFTVFYRATSMLLNLTNPYDVDPRTPWIYSNPVTYPQWYAYPPFALLVWGSLSLPLKALHLLNLFTFRIVEKASLIFAVFWMARRMEKLRKGSGKFVILNPLIWFTASVHGMPDAMAASLLIESIYLYRNGNRAYWVPLALSLSTKQTSWITLPAFLGAWLRERRFKDLALTLLLFAVINAPFFGKGYVSNVLSMHNERPPASLGYTGVPLLFIAGDVATFHIANIIAPCFGKPLPKNGIGYYVLSMAFVAFALYAFFKSLKGEFYASLALLGVAFALFSKVVSPQNLVVPLVLLILYGIDFKWLVLPSVFATFVDLVLGTVYGPLGYLAEDVLNRFGTSIVYLFRSSLGTVSLSFDLGALSLLLYHVTLMITIYSFAKKYMSARKFLLLYVIYLILVSNSIRLDKTGNNVPFSSVDDRIAVIWLWLNPYNGFKAGDYIGLRTNVTKYYEYTYPLVLEELKWLKERGYGVVGLVYSIDRDHLYEYVPWLFAIHQLGLKYVWVIVEPRKFEDYLRGWASYPPGYPLTKVLKRVYELTPNYVNERVKEIYRVLKVKNSVSCPLSYLTLDGRPVIFVIGNELISSKNAIVKELPANATVVNDFYRGMVLKGSPIT